MSFSQRFKGQLTELYRRFVEELSLHSSISPSDAIRDFSSLTDCTIRKRHSHKFSFYVALVHFFPSAMSISLERDLRAPSSPADPNN